MYENINISPLNKFEYVETAKIWILYLSFEIISYKKSMFNPCHAEYYVYYSCCVGFSISLRNSVDPNNMSTL